MPYRDFTQDYELIEKAAIAGDRCPQSWPHGPIRTGAVGALVNRGLIRSAVYRHNYRVITILKGQHRGKHTKMPNTPGAPYRINGVQQRHFQ